MRHNPNTVTVKVDAGSIDRNNDLIRFPFNPKDHFPDWQEGVSTLAVTQTDADGSPLDTETPAQFEPTIRELSLADRLPRCGRIGTVRYPRR